MSDKEHGFGIVEIIIVVVVVAIGAFAGYRIWQYYGQPASDSADTATSTQAAPQDITQTESELDTAAVDESTLTELDGQLTY